MDLFNSGRQPHGKQTHPGVLASLAFLLVLVLGVSLAGGTAISHAAQQAAHVTSPASSGSQILTASAPTTTTTPVATSTPVPISGPALVAGVYHFVGSLVASPGAQVSHVEGILSLQVAADGALTGSTLRLTSGTTIAVSGAGNRGLLGFDTDGMHFSARSSAIGGNRTSGLFIASAGDTIGFWVATRVVQGQMGTKYTFTGHIASGPDAGMSYNGTLELWGDTFGGLIGWLTEGSGKVLTLSGQSVNGNVNMLVIVRSGTPFIASGTRDVSGNLRGTINGPLAGDQGTWAATK